MQPCPSGERQVRKRQEKSRWAHKRSAEPQEPSIFLDAREGRAPKPFLREGSKPDGGDACGSVHESLTVQRRAAIQ